MLKESLVASRVEESWAIESQLTEEHGRFTAKRFIVKIVPSGEPIVYRKTSRSAVEFGANFSHFFDIFEQQLEIEGLSERIHDRFFEGKHVGLFDNVFFNAFEQGKSNFEQKI